MRTVNEVNQYARLAALGERYYETCEEYNLGVCSKRSSIGIPIPVDASESRKVKSFARKLENYYKNFYRLSNKEFMKALRLARQRKNNE